MDGDRNRDYEGGQPDNMMDEVEVRSKKKRRMKKVRICGKRLTKNE